MASASSTSAKSLFSESKSRLADRVQVNVNNISSVARQIQRGSKSSEGLNYAARNFAQQESAIEASDENFKKMSIAVTHLNYQFDSVSKNCQLLEDVKEQVRAMQR